MKYFIFIFFITLFFFNRRFGKTEEVKLLTLAYDESGEYIGITMENEFREYAANNNLNITLNVVVLKYEKASDSYSFFKSFIESSLKKQNSPYDIYFYNSIHINLFGPYLLNLINELSEEYINIYNSKILTKECYYKDKLIGIPLVISHEVLYSNKDLLSKYNKPIPQTWDELIEICKDIMEKENDPELICYNGLFDDTEQGLFSLYQFIYSCRDSYNSTYPNPQDQSFRNALNMLKRLKNEVDSDGSFSSTENLTFMKLNDGKAVFLKYWLIGDPALINIPYNVSILPGLKEGISGSMLKEHNLGIVRSLEENKKEAVLEVFKHFTSKEYQKNMFKNSYISTAISEFLDDEEMCKTAPCDLDKKVQFTGEPQFIKDGPESYRKKYKKYIYQFLNENKSIDETIKQIIDITKIYLISVDTKDSYVGLIFLILISVISILMLLSLILLFNEKLDKYFVFLSNDFWIITVLGSIMILWVPVFNYGPVKSLKCHLKLLLLSIGYTLNVYPTMYKLMSQFPKKLYISLWVKDHKYMLLLLNVLVDVLLNSISLMDVYTPKLILVEDGESFEICNYIKKFCILFIVIFKFMEVFLLSFLVFVERNISETMYDVKFIFPAIYMNTLSFILIVVFYIIEIKHYKSLFIILTINILIISITNFIFLYIGRIFLMFIKTKDSLVIEEVSKNHFNFVVSDSTTKNTSLKNNTNSVCIIASREMENTS